jgi:hypothetical protein
MLLGNIPHDYSTIFMLVFLLIFIVAHVIWLHKVIQTLRQDLKTSRQDLKISPDSSRFTPHPSPHFTSSEDEHNRDVLVEATFFQLLRDHLNIAHSPHIQAQCLQDNKTHLIQTSGLIPLLKDNQLEILAQPIVSLPQKRLSFFQCVPCVTVENGMVINLNTISGFPNHLSSHQAIERMILFQTLQFVRRHHKTHPNHGFVCTLSPTLYKNLQCIEEIGDFLHQSHFPFQALIFEVPLDISDSLFTNLAQLKSYGVRFIGKWQNKDLPKILTELPIRSVDFVMLPYFELSGWLKKQPRRQSLESLQQILELIPQTIVSDVDKEQDLYHYLPVPFDFASGDAFGLVKPFYHIQV